MALDPAFPDPRRPIDRYWSHENLGATLGQPLNDNELWLANSVGGRVREFERGYICHEAGPGEGVCHVVSKADDEIPRAFCLFADVARSTENMARIHEDGARLLAWVKAVELGMMDAVSGAKLHATTPRPLLGSAFCKFTGDGYLLVVDLDAETASRRSWNADPTHPPVPESLVCDQAVVRGVIHRIRLSLSSEIDHRRVRNFHVRLGFAIGPCRRFVISGRPDMIGLAISLAKRLCDLAPRDAVCFPQASEGIRGLSPWDYLTLAPRAIPQGIPADKAPRGFETLSGTLVCPLDSWPASP